MTMTLFAAGDLVADLCWCSLMCDHLLCDSLHPAAKGWLQFLCELEEQCCLVGTCGNKHVEEGVLEMVNWNNFYE